MLHACPSCQRHLRQEAACPHCGAAQQGRKASPTGPWGRAVKKLKVGGLMAFTAATTSACYGTPAVVGLPDAPATGLTVPLDAMPVRANRANVYLFDQAQMPAPSARPSGSASPSALPSAEASASTTPSPEGAATASAEASASGAPSPEGSASASATPEGSATPTAAPSPSASVAPSASPVAGPSPMPRYSVGLDVDGIRMENGRLRLSLSGRFDHLEFLLELPEGQDPLAVMEAQRFELAQLASGQVDGNLGRNSVLFTMPGGAQSTGWLSLKPRPNGTTELILVVSQRGQRLQINALLDPKL